MYAPDRLWNSVKCKITKVDRRKWEAHVYNLYIRESFL